MANQIRQIASISEFHKMRGLSSPLHPLVSLIDYSKTTILPEFIGEQWYFDFYSIGIKRDVAPIRYGQKKYDFDEGLMSFIAPRQILSIEAPSDKYPNPSGWLLLIHPDFFWNASLAAHIKQYDFFGYAISEALFMSEKEERIMAEIMANIQLEIENNIDSFSQNIIIAQIELLLSYAERFYKRQFITREKVNHEILDQLESLLSNYFDDEDLLKNGLPTVQYVADSLLLSPNYLSSLLKSLSGRNTQQHIHEKVIEKAKERLSTTPLSVSEIAYSLGFEHAQSFSKLFKLKTKKTPSQFREAYH